MACDMMVAVPVAKIGHSEIKPASIAFPGLLMLQRPLPSNLLTQLLAGGDPMDVTDPYRLGVNQPILKDAFEADVARFASRFARISRPVLQLMMHTLRLAHGKALDRPCRGQEALPRALRGARGHGSKGSSSLL